MIDPSVTTQPVSVLPGERHTVDYLADMYAVVTSLERLERAHHRDLVTGDEHGKTLERLMSKFESIEGQLHATHQSRYDGLDNFMAEYDMSASCAAAKARLQSHHRRQAERVDEQERQRQAVLAAHQAQERAVNPQQVLEAAQNFITLLDALKLGQTAADQIHPLIIELLRAVTKVDPRFAQLPRLERWRDKIDAMRASETLDETETRDMCFDIEKGYQGFYQLLGEGSKAPVPAPVSAPVPPPPVPHGVVAFDARSVSPGHTPITASPPTNANATVVQGGYPSDPTLVGAVAGTTISPGAAEFGATGGAGAGASALDIYGGDAVNANGSSSTPPRSGSPGAGQPKDFNPFA